MTPSEKGIMAKCHNTFFVLSMNIIAIEKHKRYEVFYLVVIRYGIWL
jgi:hypothetical protein